jgi:hypothetical protein
MRRKMNDMPEWSSVRKMSNEDLKRFLDNNTQVDPHLLSVITSEILRRQMNSPEMMRNELN